jgi:PAS domain S-box-containing protein
MLEQRVAERTTELTDTVTALLAEIDERVKIEKALEKSGRDIEDLYNLAPCGYHSLDKDGIFVRVNETELHWLGYTRDELVGKMGVSDVLTPESLSVFVQNFPQFTKGCELSDMRMQFIRKDGSILPVLLNAVPIIGKNGDYLMSRSTIYDISDLVRAEESAKRQNLLYLCLSETGKAIAHLPDREALFAEICRITVEHGGFLLSWIGMVDELNGDVHVRAAHGATSYLSNIRITANKESYGEGPTGIAISNGTYYICNDFQNDPSTLTWHERGKMHGINASASFALKCGGRVCGTLNLYAAETDFFDQQHIELLQQIVTDVSFALDNFEKEEQRKRMEKFLYDETVQRLRAVEALREKEQLLMQQSRQAAMGEMIGNIAHQWRQPLNALALSTQRLDLFYDTPRFNKEFLNTSVKKSMEIIQYMSRTIDDFRNFFLIEREKSEFSVIESVRRALSLVDSSFNDRSIHVEIDERQDSKIQGYPNEYAQVLLNILLNAKDAIDERTIATPCLKIAIDAVNGISVVTIGDNAGGISGEFIDKVFNPYFTTKGPQQGTGVGLFMAKTIIEKNMGGRLTVCNTDVGAEFRIEV